MSLDADALDEKTLAAQLDDRHAVAFTFRDLHSALSTLANSTTYPNPPSDARIVRRHTAVQLRSGGAALRYGPRRRHCLEKSVIATEQVERGAEIERRLSAER